MAFLDSPWSLVALYQDDPKYQFKYPVKGALSLAWSNFDEPGILHKKPAKECTAKEIEEEVMAQIYVS